MGSSQSQQNGVIYGGASRAVGNPLTTSARAQQTLFGVGYAGSARSLPGIGSLGPNVNSPVQPATVPQYAITFFTQLSTYAYIIAAFILQFAFIIVVIGLISKRCGSGTNKYILVYLYDFVNDQYRRSYRMVTMIKPGKNKLMFWGLRAFASLIYAWWVLVVGIVKTIMYVLSDLGIIVPALIIWFIWTFMTYNYPFALNTADLLAVSAQNVTNVLIWSWGTLIHVVNAISPYTNQVIYTGIRFLQITIYDGVFTLLGGTDQNPLFQEGSIFSFASDMLPLQTTFGRRLQEQDNKLFGFIETFARFFAQIQALWDFIVLVVYNIVVTLSVTVLQTSMGVVFTIVNVLLCSIQVLPCAILQVIQYITEGIVFIVNEAFKFIVYIITFGTVTLTKNPIDTPDIACRGGALASVPCSCATFFTSMDECGSFEIECRPKDGVYYEYKVFPGGREVLLNQGTDKSVVCPNQRRVLSNYHEFVEEELGYVACIDLSLTDGIQNVTLKRCPGYTYGEPHHARALMALDMHVALSSPTTPPDSTHTAPPTVTWYDHVRDMTKTHLAAMNKQNGMQCDEASIMTDPSCYLHLALFAGKETVNKRVMSIMDESVRSKIVVGNGRKLQQETKVNQMFYALHQMKATAEMRWIEYQETGANPFRELHPKASERLRRRMQESGLTMEVPKLWAYDRTVKGVTGLIEHVANFPHRRELIATQSPTFPKYGAWTGVQCPNGEYLCPSNVCLPTKKQCPPPSTGSWLQWLEYWFLRAELYVADVKPSQAVSAFLNCYNDYIKHKERNPFLIDHYQSTNPEINKYFVYCWPLVDYIDPNVYVPAYVSGWSVRDYVESQCTNGECQCNGYWFSLFETQFEFVEGVPYFSVANLYDGALAFWTFLCQFLFAPGGAFPWLTNDPWQAILRPFYSWGWVSVGVYYFWWDQGQGTFVNGVYVPASQGTILLCSIYNFNNIAFLVVFIVLLKAFFYGLGLSALYAVWALLVNIVVLPLQGFSSDEEPPEMTREEIVDVEKGN